MTLPSALGGEREERGVGRSRLFLVVVGFFFSFFNLGGGWLPVVEMMKEEVVKEIVVVSVESDAVEVEVDGVRRGKKLFISFFCWEDSGKV
jgi:hypothetical protein